jgi:hypothetical protein
MSKTILDKEAGRGLASCLLEAPVPTRCWRYNGLLHDFVIGVTNPDSGRRNRWRR